MDIFEICLKLLAIFSALMILSNFLFAPVLYLFRPWIGVYNDRVIAPVSAISVVVPAYNEQGSIEIKIDTLREAIKDIDIPVEVLIGSDGSTDSTIALTKAKLATFDSSNWHLFEFINEGKCSTINKLVGLANGDLIISTDADIPVPKDAIKKVLDTFSRDPSLGCLSCVPCFRDQELGNQNGYWRLEDTIRRAESAIGSLIVVTGMLYAYRKALFQRIPAGVMADDLWVPMNILIAGYRCIQADELRVPYEKTDEPNEIARRKRVIIGGMDIVLRLWKEVSRKPLLFTLLVFHKINRWAIPVWLTLFALSVAALEPTILIGYAIGVVFACVSMGTVGVQRLVYSLYSPVYSFCELFQRSDFAKWEHTRKH